MIPFSKMHGIGNDFVMVDGIALAKSRQEWSELSKRMCDRRFGIGSDGLIIAENSETAEFRMTMFNPDGSESEMCGNGIRCFALYLHHLGYTKAQKIDIETGAGKLSVQIQDDSVRVYMGKANFASESVGIQTDLPEFIEQPIQAGAESFIGTAVATGNPHFVIFVEDLDEIDLKRVGPEIETLPLFKNRTNVHFARVHARDRISMKTWERGAGITLACGTGACAVAASAVKTERADRFASIQLPGGSLTIEYLENGDLFKTGPAAFVCHGEYFA